MTVIKPFLRGDTYQFRMRVPRRFAAVEPIPIVQLSLHTDSMEIARRKASEVWAAMIEAWEAKLAGLDAEGDARLDAARSLAQRRGFRFMHIEDTAQLPIADLISRLNLVPNKPTKADLPIIEAALGTVEPSKIRLGEVVDEFYRAASDRVIGKSEDQLRKHKNPRKKAFGNLIEAVGDKAVADLTTEDMMAFRAWLIDRVERGKLRSDSANKEIQHILSTIDPVADAKGIKLLYTRKGLRLQTPQTEDEGQRPPFSEAWIRTKILAEGALARLNTEARLILLGMVNTGYRPSEGAGLMPEDIVLDADIPHILIRPNANRSLKNRSSKRPLPLTGVSLEAFKAAPNGFARYCKKHDSLSATVNKFLTENKLLETPEHSLYSLRHSMEDRMLRAKIDERVRMDILGHQIKRERYGDAGGLAHKYELMKAIAL